MASRKQAAIDIRRVARKLSAMADRDPEMARVYDSDAEDLFIVASFVDAGQLKKASYAAWSLDTVVRDKLPKSFYELMSQYGLD